MQQTDVSLQKRRLIVLLSSVIITALYWIIALWYTNKTSYSKDLVVFHTLFESVLRDNQWSDLLQYFFQFGVTVLLFWITPFIITKFFLRTDFKNLGLRFSYNKEAFILCAIAYTLVIISTYFSSQDPLIASEYPLSKLIGTSWLIFIVYQISYMFYFISYEIFYRGYLQFGLMSSAPRSKEIIIILIVQTILTTLFHIGKPVPEIISAAAFGPVLGYVAIRYNSIWYGMVIHFVMNIFIDYFSLKWLDLLPHSLF